MYSYQRGALIHFHPSSFKLDYFPVIFDQSVLLLKMDDRPTNIIDMTSPKLTRNDRRKISNKEQYRLLNDCLSSKSPISRSNSPEQSSSKITCLSLLKQIFHLSSSNSVNTDGETNILAYWKRREKKGGDCFFVSTVLHVLSYIFDFPFIYLFIFFFFFFSFNGKICMSMHIGA